MQPIARRTLPDAVVAQIQDLIDSRKLKPGDRLPTERELCETLNVGRSTVREAIRALVAVGVLERYRGGLYVNPDLPIQTSTITAANVQTIFETRRLLEVGLVGLAGQRVTEKELKAIAEWLWPEGEIPSMEAFRSLDVGFHQSIAAAAHNPIVEDLFTQVRDELFRSHAFYPTMESFGPKQWEELMNRVGGDHRSIFEALAEHRPRGAQLAMERHFRHVEAAIIRRLGRPRREALRAKADKEG